ncbi:hypothetical protein BD289DRAFT_430681 [Coniella lustricola]|uniref:Uncharacterized protein n=1 Tax=Coniella lustricola TaxID=2025994 RepID=A0A2T3ABK6_9PEZI|nr:hypothetical protein BD289DRAFT_430681 [Coniella lustricola]
MLVSLFSSLFSFFLFFFFGFFGLTQNDVMSSEKRISELIHCCACYCCYSAATMAMVYYWGHSYELC